MRVEIKIKMIKLVYKDDKRIKAPYSALDCLIIGHGSVKNDEELENYKKTYSIPRQFVKWENVEYGTVLDYLKNKYGDVIAWRV